MTIFLERFVLSAISALVIIVAFTGSREVTLGAIALVALAGCAWFVAEKFAGSRALKRELEPEWPLAHGGRVYVDVVKPSAVTGHYKEQADPLASRHMKAVYAGKWMRVVGAVSDVEKRNEGKIFVYLEEQSMVVLQFDETWLERIAQLERGSKIAAIGRIDFVSTVSLVLRECELVPTPERR